MKQILYDEVELHHMLEEITNDPVYRPPLIILSKADCFYLHKYISIYNDCICEHLTWNNDLIFNTEVHSCKELYENLFKLKYRGIQLGQL